MFSILFLVLVKKGDRIAQLICEKIEMADLVEDQVCFCVPIFTFIDLYIIETR
jgi:hypothetical protein